MYHSLPIVGCPAGHHAVGQGDADQVHRIRASQRRENRYQVFLS